MIQSTPVPLYDTAELSAQANSQQRQASDPLHSVWVGASAGTGKTKVLTDRVLRLLLPRPGLDDDSATDPGKILCITFTKAGAAEMAERISKTLGKWAVISDADLQMQISALIGQEPSDEMLRAARRLFAQVVDVPGGMKIMTIHAFCQSILKRFPLEAGLPPHFELMDDRTALEYMSRCQHQVIIETQTDPESDLGQAMAKLTASMQPENLTNLMGNLAQERSRLQQILKFNQGYQGLVSNLYQKFKLPEGIQKSEVLEAACDTGSFNETGLREAVAALSSGSKTDQDKAYKLQNWLDQKSFRKQNFAKEYASIFITQKGTIVKTLATKKVVTAFPMIADIMFVEAERILAIIHRLKAIDVIEYTAALMRVSEEILKRYEARKTLAAVLDYDDLIYYTRDLLNREENAAWVLFKLDQGVDHILVDEAQDTNPEQWHVIESLASEFFVGLGARDEVERTIFVVGDEKQSIFSFQRADPKAFNRMRCYFEEKVHEAGKSWQRIGLNVSFRSTSAVLHSVDEIFKDQIVRQGVLTDPLEDIEHIPFRSGHAGLVEIWPVFPVDKAEEGEEWQLPNHIALSKSAKQKAADKIADTIKNWLERDEKLESLDRPIKAGDIMVLVRRRDVFVEQLIRALKIRNVPVAGVDRMKLSEQLPVMDLLALANFMLLPDDDLTLATLLKSPLIGIDEETLFELSYRRQGSLWEVVRNRRDDISRYLVQMMQKAQQSLPYEFFAEVLGSACPANCDSGRKAFLSRLGYDALDALDEFLNASMEFEMAHIPTLQAFLSWFEKNQVSIKRQQEQSNINQVKIMTVHGSKGLQAPIVFMPDTTSSPSTSGGSSRPRLVWPSDEAGIPLWVPKKDFEDPSFAKAWDIEKQKEAEEYRRLLYVALTRAEDRLYLCGIGQHKALPKDCWYTLVRDAFAPIAQNFNFSLNGKAIVDNEGVEQFGLRVHHPQTCLPRVADQDNIAPCTRLEDLPDWAQREPAAEPVPPKPLSPSRPDEDEPAVRSPLGSDDGYRFRRGILAHQLLEVLPELPEEKWQKAALLYLQRSADDLALRDQESLCQEVIAVLKHPEFEPIFGPGSMAEVPIVGLLGAEKHNNIHTLSGSIDRMVVMEDQVLIVDYKTNRPPPQDEQGVLPVYLKQLAIYRSAVARVYPDKEIKAALLWTDGPFLMHLSSERLDAFAL